MDMSPRLVVGDVLHKEIIHFPSPGGDALAALLLSRTPNSAATCFPLKMASHSSGGMVVWHRNKSKAHCMLSFVVVVMCFVRKPTNCTSLLILLLPGLPLSQFVLTGWYAYE